MSVRYQFSYWLNARPISRNADPDKLVEEMTGEGLVLPEGYLAVTVDPKGRTVAA